MADTFEEHLKALEARVRELEAGDESLDRSLTTYEEAVQHLKACHEILARAEKRVKILVEDEDGSLVEEDFHAPEEGHGG